MLPARLARRAFTLLEVMVAVLILALLMVSVFRFVKSVLQAVRISSDATVSKQEVAGLLNYLQAQLEDLPVQQAAPAAAATMSGGTNTLSLAGSTRILGGQNTRQNQNGGAVPFGGGTLTLLPTQLGTLSGTSHKYHDLAADEMDWVCSAGPGVLTTSGEDQYRVTLAIQDVKGSRGEYEIGLRRRTVESDERNYNWLPLLRPAAALEIRYFDPRQKQWIDAWREPVFKPSLIRVRVWRTKDEPPVEAIFALPAARLQGL